MQKSSTLYFQMYGMWIWQTARLLLEFMSDMKNQRPQKLFVTWTAERNTSLQGSFAELMMSMGGGDANSCSLDCTTVPARIQAAWAGYGWKRGPTNEKKRAKKKEEVFISKFLLNQYISVHRWIPAEPVQDRCGLQVFKLNLFMEDYIYFLLWKRYYSLWIRLAAWHRVSFLICKLGMVLHISGQFQE